MKSVNANIIANVLDAYESDKYMFFRLKSDDPYENKIYCIDKKTKQLDSMMFSQWVTNHSKGCHQISLDKLKQAARREGQ